jgi:hypothetical protein
MDAMDEHDHAMLRRQEHFRLAADYVARAFAYIPAVCRIVLFGSVAAPLTREAPRRRLRHADGLVLHECKDVDLAVWLGDLGCLHRLQRARSDALNRLLADKDVGVAHHQVDVFIMDPRTDRLLGWLCHFTSCPKEGKAECLAPGCGRVPLLKWHEGFVLDARALEPARTVLLHQRAD